MNWQSGFKIFIHIHIGLDQTLIKLFRRMKVYFHPVSGILSHKLTQLHRKLPRCTNSVMGSIKSLKPQKCLNNPPLQLRMFFLLKVNVSKSFVKRVWDCVEKFINLFYSQFLLYRLILGIATYLGIYSQFPSLCLSAGSSFQYRLKKHDFPCTKYKAKTKLLLQFDNCCDIFTETNCV